MADSKSESAEQASEPYVLEGEEAMALLRAGRDEWNAWCADHPDAKVDFSGAEFEADGRGRIDFVGFQFPAGEGNVSFYNATFGKGDVSFDDAIFGEGNVSFDDAIFGEGNVSFNNATFGEGDVSFYNTTFGEGHVYFNNATFGEGHVFFYNTTFGEGHVSFYNTTFGEGHVSFDNTTFGEGHVYCNNATFGEGDVSFNKATFGEGNVSFSKATFGSGSVSFQFCTFEGSAIFLDLEDVDRCEKFSFEGARFEQLFTFSNQGRLGCPLDLRRTKLTHDVVVNDIHCGFVPAEHPTGWKFSRLMPPTAKDKEDSQRFRRLKELAVSNRNHAKALEFHAQEIESRREHETNGFQDFLLLLFKVLSNYGRSVIRPLAGLGILLASFASLFWVLRTPLAAFKLSEGETVSRSFWTAINYSGSNLLSFIPTGRTARSEGERRLFNDTTPDFVIAISAVESLCAVVLLFLLGLALRNQFRV